MNADKIKDLFKRECDTFQDGIVFHKGTVIGVLNKACNGESNRHLVLKYLTGKVSSKLLTEAEFYALYKLVLPIKPEGGHWQSGRGDAELEAMCGTLLAAAVDQPGQIKMFSETLREVNS